MEVIMKRTKDIIEYKRTVARMTGVYTCHSSVSSIVSKYVWLQIQCKMCEHISQNKHRCVRLCQLIAFLRLHRIFAFLFFFAFLLYY